MTTLGLDFSMAGPLARDSLTGFDMGRSQQQPARLATFSSAFVAFLEDKDFLGSQTSCWLATTTLVLFHSLATHKCCSDIRSMTLNSDVNVRQLPDKVGRVSVLDHYEFHPIRQKLGSDKLHRLPFEVHIDCLAYQDDGIGCAAH